MPATHPIGVFDSGVGGLSVLRALRAELPHERFIYLADNGFAPYGERGDAFVAARTRAITEHLLRAHGIKALVVACNTATAAAIHELRASYPALPLVGVEPALKPAVAASRSKRIGVMATRGTVTSAKFARLRASLESEAEFSIQPCDGLAHAIERATVDAAAAQEVQELCARYIAALIATLGPGMDTLVLGCTHYVFAEDTLRALAGPQVQLLETGQPVARQTRRLLQAADLLAPESQAGEATLLTTGDLPLLQQAAARWLQLPADRCGTVTVPMPAATV
jgi:glutamate racemase